MNEYLRNEVIRRHQAGASLRQIARDLGLSRNTVRRALAGRRRRGRARPPGERPAGPVSWMPTRLPSASCWAAIPS